MYLTTERLVYAPTSEESFKSFYAPLNKLKGLKNASSWREWVLNKFKLTAMAIPVDQSIPGPAKLKLYFDSVIEGESFFRNMQLATFDGHNAISDPLPFYF